MASDGTIYYRAGSKLYAITYSGGTLTEKWVYNFLPSGSHAATPTIDSLGRIIVCSNVSGQPNVHIFSDQTSSASLEKTFQLAFSGSINSTPSIGNDELFYLQSESNDLLYAYGSTSIPTTTTTTTTSPGTSSSSDSTSSESENSSSSSEPDEVTTTTTTYPPPLSEVITSIFINNQETEVANGSDSPETFNTPLTKSLTFGVVAPKEKSETVVVTLKVPYAQAIRNIKLALIDTGGLEFATNRFGVTSSYKLDNTVPTTYFQGVNEEKLESSPYNVIIDTQNDNTSDYVYLNVKMPDNNFIGSGVIRYRWFFDYSD